MKEAAIFTSVVSADELKTENLIVPTDDLRWIHGRRDTSLIAGAVQTGINDCGRKSVTVNYAGETKSMSAGAVQIMPPV